jgi:hypothetical protein
VDVLLDHQDGRLLLAQALEQLEDLVYDDRGEPQRGLVEQEQLRPRHERPPDGEHLLLAAGERPGGLAGALGEDGKQLVDPLRRRRHLGAVAERGAAQAEIVRHRQPREDPAALRHEREPAPDDPLGRQPRELLTVEAHTSGGSRHEAPHGPEQAGLAGPICAEQGDQLALLDAEGHFSDRNDRSVPDDEPVDLEKRRIHRLASRQSYCGSGW